MTAKYIPADDVIVVYVTRLPDGTTQVRAPDSDDADLVIDMLEMALSAMQNGTRVERQ